MSLAFSKNHVEKSIFCFKWFFKIISALLFISFYQLTDSFAETYSVKNKQKLVFVISTGFEDSRGGDSMFDEHEQIEKWEKIDPTAKVIVIRENTFLGMHQQLVNWMRTDLDKKEVVGLTILSHGSKQSLSSLRPLDSDGFYIILDPKNSQSLKTLVLTLNPLRGNFAPNARIILSGCSVLSGQTPKEATDTLDFLADFLLIKNGLLYANKTLGLGSAAVSSMYYRNIMKPGSDANKHMSILMYATWPFSVPASVAASVFGKMILNKGYILKHNVDGSKKLYEAQSEDLYNPQLSILSNKPVFIQHGNLTETAEPDVTYSIRKSSSAQ